MDILRVLLWIAAVAQAIEANCNVTICYSRKSSASCNRTISDCGACVALDQRANQWICTALVNGTCSSNSTYCPLKNTVVPITAANNNIPETTEPIVGSKPLMNSQEYALLGLACGLFVIIAILSINIYLSRRQAEPVLLSNKFIPLPRLTYYDTKRTTFDLTARSLCPVMEERSSSEEWSSTIQISSPSVASLPVILLTSESLSQLVESENEEEALRNTYHSIL